MYQFTNLPTKNGPEMEAVVTDGWFRIQTTEGREICAVSRSTPEGTASDIVDAIRFARDRGYQQALADIRRQLGIGT